MGARIVHIQKAVEAALTIRFPEHMKHCYVDVTFEECSANHIVFLAHLCVKDFESYKILCEMAPEGSNHVLQVFSYYQSAEDVEEDYFEVDGTQFVIGDGDDTAAVVEVGAWQVDIWVRYIRD